MEYLKIWCSFSEIIEPLNDSERGRLFTAMLEYAESGVLPDFKGNERYVWPAAKQNIDRARGESDRLQVNGQKGGRPRKTNENQQEPTETNENQQEPAETHKSKCNTKVNVSIKENQYYNDNSNSAGAWITDSEIQESLERDRKIEDMARRWGLPYSEGHMLKARDLAKEYTLEWLLMAIERSGSGTSQTWGYVEGILRNWKQNGGPDAPRKQQQKPAKVVSAQQYEQREYSSGELDEIGDDLLAEARRLRGTG